MVRTKIDPAALFVAWQSGAGELPDGTPFVIQEGERRRGSDPVVQHLGPAVFVPDGTPSGERPTAWDRAIATSEAEAAELPPPPPPRIDPSTPLSALYVATDKVINSRAGFWEAGLIVAEDDPPRQAVPEVFKPLLEVL